MYANLYSILIGLSTDVALKHMEHVLRTSELIQPHGLACGRLGASTQVEQVVVLGEEGE